MQNETNWSEEFAPPSLQEAADQLTSQTEKQTQAELDADFAHVAGNHLMISSKSGEIMKLEFNRAQLHIHARIEAQRKATGKVRALILKGRQQGCSSYVAARFYHRTMRTPGLRTFILTHEEAATQNLFEIVQRYHDNCPAHLAPHTGASN